MQQAASARLSAAVCVGLQHHLGVPAGRGDRGDVLRFEHRQRQPLRSDAGALQRDELLLTSSGWKSRAGRSPRARGGRVFLCEREFERRLRGDHAGLHGDVGAEQGALRDALGLELSPVRSAGTRTRRHRHLMRFFN